MQSLVTLIVMLILWYGRKVTLYHAGKIIAIGTVRFISDQWLTLRCVSMSHVPEHKGKLAISRNRIDIFRLYEEGDEKHLEALQYDKNALMRGIAPTIDGAED